MTLQQETNCIATPGFAGFVPSLKYQFGLTYGNATRHILRTDPSLKKGLIQTELGRKFRATKAPTTIAENENGSDDASKGVVWKVGRNKYATGDDRFSFPPVPGYTGMHMNYELNWIGYIPRSQEHFGRPYVETTNASLASFQSMLKSKNQLPPRIQAIKAKQEQDSSKPASTPKPPPTISAPNTANYDSSPYRLPPGHAQKTFISGYTGYVPRLQNFFGEVRSVFNDCLN